jgi:hypothetical protein
MRKLRAFIKIGYDEYIVPNNISAVPLIKDIVKLQHVDGGAIEASLTYRIYEEIEESEDEEL